MKAALETALALATGVPAEPPVPDPLMELDGAELAKRLGWRSIERSLDSRVFDSLDDIIASWGAGANCETAKPLGAEKMRLAKASEGASSHTSATTPKRRGEVRAGFETPANICMAPTEFQLGKGNRDGGWSSTIKQVPSTKNHNCRRGVRRNSEPQLRDSPKGITDCQI